jgi:hypothetical protein
MNKFNKYFTITFIVALLVAPLVFLGVKVSAHNDNSIVWCHVEPNGNQQTLVLPEQALSGHVDAEGNILHAGDHEGACEVASPTPSVTPTLPPILNCDWDECPTASPSASPTASPSATPVVQSPTPSDVPTSTPTNTPVVQSGGSGVSDGLGCSSHDCSVHPTFPAVAMANTGSSAETIYLLIMGVGAVILGLSVYVYYKHQR